MKVNQNRIFLTHLILGLWATQAPEVATMSSHSDTLKQAFSDGEISEGPGNFMEKGHFHSHIELKRLLSLRERYKRESLTRSRRQGLGLLPTEEENGESGTDIFLLRQHHCFFSYKNLVFEKTFVSQVMKRNCIFIVV